jgi:hypothetical protein
LNRDPSLFHLSPMSGPALSSSLCPFVEEDVFVIGLRRSGIHAVLSWLLPHFPGVLRLINDAAFDPEGADPLAAHLQRYYAVRNGQASELMLHQDTDTLVHQFLRANAVPFAAACPPWFRPLASSALRKFKRFQKPVSLWPRAIPYPADPLRVADRNVFVVENITPREFAAIYPRWHERNYAPFLARAGLRPPVRRRFVIMVREPWNQLSSILKNPPLEPPRPLPPEEFLGKWRDYAEEFAGRTGFLDELGGVLRVNYSRWFRDGAYRAELAGRLGVELTDFGLEVVPDFGGGSSFEGKRMSGRAQQMNVGERWKANAEHPLMRSLLADEAVRDLCAEIFGEAAPAGA